MPSNFGLVEDWVKKTADSLGLVAGFYDPFKLEGTRELCGDLPYLSFKSDDTRLCFSSKDNLVAALMIASKVRDELTNRGESAS